MGLVHQWVAFLGRGIGAKSTFDTLSVKHEALPSGWHPYHFFVTLKT